MRTITSTQNPRIQALRALQQAKGRQAAGCFLVEGEKLCGEALRDAWVEVLLVDEAKAAHYAPLVARARDVILAPAHVVDAVCEARTPQGIAASVRLPAPLDLDAAPDALLVLDGVQDPGNVGAMLRTAEAAGFGGALLSPACADAFAPKAARASMGSVLRLPLWRGALAQALALLRARDYQLITTAMDGQPLREVAWAVRRPLALAIGSEGKGISDAVAAQADLRVSLPMRGRVESLNAAVAAGILMYGILENMA